MRTRLLILERGGHSVTQAKDLRRVLEVCEGNQFAVAVLGPHLRQMEKLRVTDAVRKHCPGAKILELYTVAAPEIPNEVDAHLPANSDNLAGELVGPVNRLSDRKPKKKTAGSIARKIGERNASLT